MSSLLDELEGQMIVTWCSTTGTGNRRSPQVSTFIFQFSENRNIFRINQYNYCLLKVSVGLGWRCG
jgi:hypothetical protein